MTTTSPSQATDHFVQICRERSARGVATRSDWQRLAELNPDRAYRELKNYLQTELDAPGANPYETSGRPRVAGLTIGFLVGVVFMAAWWLFGDYLQREVITTARQWDLVTFSQYVAASMLPVFAWAGWRIESRRRSASEQEQDERVSLKNATWDELLARFDATRRAGGTRMY